MLLLGAISLTQAVHLEQMSVTDINNNQAQSVDIVKAADKKAAADASQKAMNAAQKAKESWKKVQEVEKNPGHEEKL